MTVGDEFQLDFAREDRIGLPEAVFAEGKSAIQIDAILTAAKTQRVSLFITRLDAAKLAALDPIHAKSLDYCAISRTAVLGTNSPRRSQTRIAVLCAGTSDVPVAREAMRTLAFQGEDAALIADVGVAGLWRLTKRIDEIRSYPILIVAAGMDAALPSVVAGLVASVVIAVPTSVGYGVATGGGTALNAILASCAPGIVTVNIDNGYGAACAALRFCSNASRALGPVT